MGLRSSGPLSKVFMDKWMQDMKKLEERTMYQYAINP